MISISALGTSGPGKVPHSPRMGCASLDGLAQGQDQIQHIVTGRYSDAALKNYALIPVTTVVVTMMVVGVIGIVMTVVIVAIVTMVVTMAIEIGVLRRPWISWWGGWTILSHGKRNSAHQQGRR